MRTAAHARAAEDEDIVQVLDPLDPIHLCGGEPYVVLQIPAGFRNVFVFPTSAGLHDANPIAVCTENLIHVDEMRESPKLTRWLRFYALCLRSWPRP